MFVPELKKKAQGKTFGYDYHLVSYFPLVPSLPSNVKEKVKKDIEPHGHNFEAVVSFKEYCDKKDKFYIYKINDCRGNLDQPSYVFKTSSLKLDVALNVDCDGDHFMNFEFCFFFDGKRKHCRGFVTLTASVYHPLLREKITLATMEAEAKIRETLNCFGTSYELSL